MRGEFGADGPGYGAPGQKSAPQRESRGGCGVGLKGCRERGRSEQRPRLGGGVGGGARQGPRVKLELGQDFILRAKEHLVCLLYSDHSNCSM